jgi:outer membrane protein TolC
MRKKLCPTKLNHYWSYQRVTRLFCLFLFAFIQQHLLAQETPQEEAARLDSSVLVRPLQLRPLSILLELAVQNSPSIKANVIEISKYKTAAKIQKLSWTDALQFNTGVVYGNGALLDETNNGSSVSYLLSDRRNLSQTIGLSLRLSSGMFLLNKHRNQLADLQVERFHVEREIKAQGIREDVISLYVQLESALRMLTLKAQTLESQRLSMNIADKYFREGTMSVTDYNTFIGQFSTAEENIEKVRADAKRLYLLLRDLVGAPIQEPLNAKKIKK